MSEVMKCPNCSGAKWEIRGLELTCTYCGYVKTIEEKAQENLSDKYAFEFLRMKEEKKSKSREMIVGLIIVIFIFGIPLFMLSGGPFLLLYNQSNIEKSSKELKIEKLGTKIEALEVIGLTGKEATALIKEIDSGASIEYLVTKEGKGFLDIDTEVPTSNLDLKVKKMDVNYWYSDEEKHGVQQVSLLLE